MKTVIQLGGGRGEKTNLRGGNKNLVGGVYWEEGGYFLVGGCADFWLVGGLPAIPPVEETLISEH